MPWTAILAVVLSLMLVVPAGAGEANNALTAFKRGDYASAVKEWRALAAKGDADAEFNLGLMYETGMGVPQDRAQALIWYRKAANQGQADAQNNLGFMYAKGIGVTKDPVKALTWYRKAAKQGHARAKNNIRMIHANERGATVKGESASEGGDYRIQLVSVSSKAGAEKEAARLARTYKTLLAGLELFLAPANLGQRGVVHRVRAGPLRDRAAAMALCRKFAAREQSCLVIEP